MLFSRPKATQMGLELSVATIPSDDYNLDPLATFYVSQ
jgi:hypothetical protein